MSCVRRLALCVLLLPAAAAAVENDEETEEITIKGRRTVLEESDEVTISPERSTPSAPDAAGLLELAPGGAVQWNGPISGQVQYRGLHGPRVGNRVNGVEITPGGPNWMDPPLHYAPRGLVESVEVERGIASVGSGAETLGGAVRTELLGSEFASDGVLRFDGALNLESRSVDGSFHGGALVSVAGESQRLHLLASGDRGRHYSSPDGTVRNTRFERIQVGSGYGLLLGEHELGLGFRYNDTRDSGTPALPMDIRFVETQLWSGSYSGRLGPAELGGRLYYTDVDHRMDNFALRAPPANPMMFRSVDASGRSGGWELQGRVPLPLGTLGLGVDGHHATHDMDIRNPNAAAFFVRNFDDASRHRTSAFAEWIAEPREGLRTELGVRYARVGADADPVDATPAQLLPPAMALRDAFNAADRDRADHLVDAVGRISFAPREELRFELAGGRKSRAPFHVERYQWIPLEVTAGTADGNNYVGHIGLDPEVSHEVSGGFTWTGYGLHLAPRGFYKRVDGYIQGTPATDPNVIAVSTANGDPTPLVWTNVDAELWGADLEAGLDLPGPLQLDGTLSWVRGVRRDIRDDLFRIAPLRGRVALSWQAESWFAAVEGEFADRQRKVSLTNGETPTGGHAIMNLYGGFEPWPGVELMLGIDNVTDALYREHLAGQNRVANSGVALGQRLPGPGRSFYGRLGVRWGAPLE